MGFDPEEYRRAFWREARKTGHTIGPVPYGLAEYRRGSPLQMRGSILFYFAAMACSLPFWFIRRAIDRHLARLRRPTYYEVERQRRHELAEERRRVRGSRLPEKGARSLGMGGSFLCALPLRSTAISSLG